MTSDTIDDEDLGPLRWDPTYRWWRGQVQLTCEQPFELLIHSLSETPSPPSDHARQLLARIRGLEPACLTFASDELLEIHTSEWCEGHPLQPDEFRAHLTPDGVEVYADGYAAVHFHAGDLFWGHGVSVRIRPDGTLSEVALEG